MRTHILACTYQGFGCSGRHISGWLVLAILGFIALVSLASEWERRH